MSFIPSSPCINDLSSVYDIEDRSFMHVEDDMFVFRFFFFEKDTYCAKTVRVLRFIRDTDEKKFIWNLFVLGREFCPLSP